MIKRILIVFLLSVCFSAFAKPSLDEVMTKANQGDAEYQFYLAEKYRSGDEVEKSLDKTIEWHKKAVKNGNNNSDYLLGIIYLTSDLKHRDLAKSITHLKAANAKSPQIANQWLKWFTIFDLKAKEDLTLSKADYEKAAEKGDQQALFLLGVMSYLSIEGTQDIDKAIKYFSQMDATPSPKVDRALGYMYLEKASEIMFNDPDRAQWQTKAKNAFIKASNKGDTLSQTAVAELYLRDESGESVSMAKSFDKGVEWLEKAANNGSVIAQLRLGMLYFNGDQISADKQKAKYWLEKAALQGDPNAQQAMGVIYFLGQGVPIDYTQAAKWYEKAAIQGGDNSMVALGRMYKAGLGVSHDLNKANFLFNKACDMGNREGCMLVGRNRVGQAY